MSTVSGNAWNQYPGGHTPRGGQGRLPMGTEQKYQPFLGKKPIGTWTDTKPTHRRGGAGRDLGMQSPLACQGPRDHCLGWVGLVTAGYSPYRKGQGKLPKPPQTKGACHLLGPPCCFLLCHPPHGSAKGCW